MYSIYKFRIPFRHPFPSRLMLQAYRYIINILSFSSCKSPFLKGKGGELQNKLPNVGKPLKDSLGKVDVRIQGMEKAPSPYLPLLLRDLL